MKKIVINGCYGGFGLSLEAVKLYAELKGFKIFPFIDKPLTGGRFDFERFYPYTEDMGCVQPFLIHYGTKPLNPDGSYIKDAYFSPRNIARDDEYLVKVVEKLGKKANGECAKLKIIEIPDYVKWEIEDEDGLETVEEQHRRWN